MAPGRGGQGDRRVCVGILVDAVHCQRIARVPFQQHAIGVDVWPLVAVGRDDVELRDHAEAGVEEDVAVEDPPADAATHRDAVGHRTIVEPHSERQRVAAGDVDVVTEVAVREHVAGRRARLDVGRAIRRVARLCIRQADRLNREAVQMERMVSSGRIGHGQLEDVAELCVPRRPRLIDVHIVDPGEIMFAENAVDAERAAGVRQPDILGREAWLRRRERRGIRAGLPSPRRAFRPTHRLT